jgi:hypothetical protein
MSQVIQASGREIIDAENRVAFAQQTIREV